MMDIGIGEFKIYAGVQRSFLLLGMFTESRDEL